MAKVLARESLYDTKWSSADPPATGIFSIALPTVKALPQPWSAAMGATRVNDRSPTLSDNVRYFSLI
jgi:hypothetical protein